MCFGTYARVKRKIKKPLSDIACIGYFRITFGQQYKT